MVTGIYDPPEGMPGYLVSSMKGLYLFDDRSTKPARLRKYPTAWALPGCRGVVAFEEFNGVNRITMLDKYLDEVCSNEEMAREVNPKILWNCGLINLDHASFVHLNLLTGDRNKLCDISPTRSVTRFAQVEDNAFEFLAIHRGDKWPTVLYRMDLKDSAQDGAVLTELAHAEDPIFAGIFLPLGEGRYLVISQGESALEVYRFFDGETPGLRSWGLAHPVGDHKPAGCIVRGDTLYMVTRDSLIKLKMSID